MLKSLIFFAFLLFGCAAANAQTTGNPSSDTTHHQMMHRRWGNGMGGDTAHRGFHKDGAFRGGPGHNGFHGQGNWAFHRPGQNGRFGHNRFGHNRFVRNRFGRGRRSGGNIAVQYTPGQRKQIMAINKDYRQKSADLFKQDNITLKQYKAGLIALQKDKKTKMEALLTPQQKTDMTARRKRMDENVQVMEAARLERLKLHLNLTDDQVAKIKAGQDGLRDQVKAIHENENLLPQEKREQMKALLAKRTDTYKSVLTPDQYTQFEQMSHHRPGGMQGHRPGFGGDKEI